MSEKDPFKNKDQASVRARVEGLLNSFETHEALKLLQELFPQGAKPLLKQFKKIKKSYADGKITLDQRNNEYSYLANQVREMLKSQSTH
jgi:chromosome segregation and condensation protein ScpB